MSAECDPCRPSVQTEYRVRFLSYRAHITGPSRAISVAEHLFPPTPVWACSDRPITPLLYRIEPAAEDGGQWRIYENDVFIRTLQHSSALPPFLAWLITTRAIDTVSSDYLLFHAGAIAVGQAGVILPGRSGSGKSTLTAALIADGCSYFNDEVAVIDSSTGALLPFGRAVKLEPASLPILASRYPELNGDAYRQGRAQNRTTYLRPPDRSIPLAPILATLVIFPQYQPETRTTLRKLPRSEGFASLLAHSFSARRHADTAISSIISLLNACQCYELTYSALEDAVQTVMSLAGESDRLAQPPR
jgi:hypothetical protein